MLGAMHAAAWDRDPRRLTFTLARYKFVAKMLAGQRVLEIGCGDMTASRIVAQTAEALLCTDRVDPGQRDIYHGLSFQQHDIITGPISGGFDSAFSLDVLEHINPWDEDRFMSNMAASIREHGTIIIGMPSLESQPYASDPSRAAHVNCKTEDGLRATMSRHCRSVFLFGMNDETLHTGFGPLCQYRLALGVR